MDEAERDRQLTMHRLIGAAFRGDLEPSEDGQSRLDAPNKAPEIPEGVIGTPPSGPCAVCGEVTLAAAIHADGSWIWLCPECWDKAPEVAPVTGL